MYVHLTKMAEHWDVKHLMDLVEQTEYRNTLNKLGLYYLGQRVTLVKPIGCTEYEIRLLSELGTTITVIVSDDVLKALWLKEYRYHEYINDPLKIAYEDLNLEDYATFEPDTRHQPDETLGEAIGVCLFAMAVSLVGFSAYKKFTK